MSNPRWIEGIHYERLPSGSLRCLKCQKELKGPSALGPHLSVCLKEEITAPTPLQTSETGLTQQDQLRQYLSEVGFKRIDAVARLVERYGFNTLGIYAALKDCNANLSTIRYVLKAWASYNNEPIPDWILREINASPIPGGLQYYVPPQAEGETLKKEELPQILNQWWSERQKEEEVKQLREEIEMLKRELSEGNPKKSSELEEIKKLLLEKEKNEVLDRLRRLEDYVHGPISNVYGLLGLTVKETADIIKNSPLRTYVLTGQLPSPPKEVEEGAKEGIFSRISKKYVVESD